MWCCSFTGRKCSTGRIRASAEPNLATGRHHEQAKHAVSARVSAICGTHEFGGDGRGSSTMNRGEGIAAFERHFTPRTLAELWGFSEDTIQRWFEDQPGVLKHGDEGGRGR